jgi:UDP-N-acetylmuramyl pentapeptide phosphotransferase/UDP-N-acetylglucosamine-1-phosphate transferase
MKLNIIILLFLLCFGLLVVPLGLFAINDFIFGKYSGDGFVGFYDDYFDLLKNGNLFSWFILFSPYLVYLVVRLIIKFSRKFNTRK